MNLERELLRNLNTFKMKGQSEDPVQNDCCLAGVAGACSKLWPPGDILARDVGSEAATDFIASLATTDLTLKTPLQDDYSRTAEPLRQYADASLDFVDVMIVAMSERLVITRLLALEPVQWQLRTCRNGQGVHRLR